MLQKKSAQVSSSLHSKKTLGDNASSSHHLHHLHHSSRQEGEYRISDQDAVRCALSIPEEFVPTPHKEFIKDLEDKQETHSKKQQQISQSNKERPMLSPIKKMTTTTTATNNNNNNKPSIQNGGEGAEYHRLNPGKTLLVRDRERKLRSAFAKYKKWDEAERCTVERLEGNRIMIDDDIIMDINHTDYIKEQDVVLELDVDYRTCSMPPSPRICNNENNSNNCGDDAVDSVDANTDATTTTTVCQAPSCRLGCICESIRREPVVRTHCGKPRCFFECTCSQSLFNNGDDGDIRSRLRPRVSLLNWRFMESAERDKDPPPVNYRQLERGIAIYPRMRRVPVAPQRFRNEYIMSTKFKDTLNRERRKPVGITKFIRKPPTTTTAGVKRDAQGTIYRRNYLVKPSVKSKEISPKIPNIRPCSVSIDALQPVGNAQDEDEEEICPLEPPPEQEPLEIPKLVQVIQRDGIIVLMGVDTLCFVTFTVHNKFPRAMVYHDIDGDEFSCPWLYLPFTSSGESWIFHPIQNNDVETTFTCIPEINCIVPTKALTMHMKMARSKKKTVALKMLWVGQDSKQRQGSIYMLPAIPNVLVCGPFPHYLMKTRFSSEFHNLDRILNFCSTVDNLSSGRFAGDVESWDTFFSKKKDQHQTSIQAQLKKDQESGRTTQAIIPEAAFDMSPIDSPSGSDPDQQQPSSPESAMNSKSNKLRVSWNDAAKLLTVQP